MSSFPTVTFGHSHYKCLERAYIQTLENHKGNFDNLMVVSLLATEGVKWWLNSIINAYNNIKHRSQLYTVTTETFVSGWDAFLVGKFVGGSFVVSEAKFHKNVLKLRAFLFGLKVFVEP